MLWYDNSAVLRNALLAQLDRVFGYEPKGQGFESLAARQVKATPWVLLLFLCLRGIRTLCSAPNKGAVAERLWGFLKFAP